MMIQAPARKAHYLAQFINQCGKPCFVQVHASTAAELASHGYRLNQMGKDSALSLPTHSFKGKRNETLRYSERWLQKNGYHIHECGDGEYVAELSKISDDWRAGRIVRRREMRFLNRPFRLSLTPGCGGSFFYHLVQSQSPCSISTRSFAAAKPLATRRLSSGKSPAPLPMLKSGSRNMPLIVSDKKVRDHDSRLVASRQRREKPIS
ncbi:phosphatidylglycerol lysyltransferase domain-containing protein [Rhizobium leguminosarum]|uniref:phosphatidylglycerol lysyltransferase domain-containing protein n=1 Tax=Rhizobium leguminosarum TaxID=384 RepID=UPI001FE1EA93|nr:phosphatidylglycerol lysyltransferase domain-containing protein [Rhizobium leguminosarum]